MKKIFSILLALLLLFSVFGCSKADEITDASSFLSESDRSLETLREIYPEYFSIGDFKGVEVYVWKVADGKYRCGILSGTNRNKTMHEIIGLYDRSLSPSECRSILYSLGISSDEVCVRPVTQPLSSYYQEIDDNYLKELRALFPDYHIADGEYYPEFISASEVTE